MRAYRRSFVVVLALILTAAEPAIAQEQAKPPGPIAVAGKVGVVLPQIATELGTTFGGEIEGAYRLPLFWGRLNVYGSLGYTQPRVSRSNQDDPRLPAAFDGTQTQRELTLSIGGLMRWKRPEHRWNVYGALALRVYFLETVTVGSAGGEEFGENTEQSTRFGAVVTGGGEWRLWSGALTGELQIGGSGLPHVITGDVSTMAIVALAGYRFFFN